MVDIEQKVQYSTFMLPSRGAFYAGKLPEGKMDVTAMTTREEKILAGSIGTVENKLNTIIRRCAQLPEGLAVDDLLSADKFFLMIVIRALSYGEEYKIRTKCDSCGKQNSLSVSLLQSVPCKMVGESEVLSEPFEVTLPVNGHKIGFNLLRGRDETAIAKYAEMRMEKGGELGDPAYEYKIARQIATINGAQISPVDALAYVERMVGRDSLTLRNAIELRTPGMETDKMKMECQFCGTPQEYALPISAEFFRPRL